MGWSKVTLMGFEEWLNYDNKSLFDGLKLPEGIDLDTLKSNIFREGGEFEVLYANPDYMVTNISKWGRKWYRTFEKWVRALEIEYEPLYNYDRYEDWTESGKGSRENKSDTSSKSETANTQISDMTDETENTRSAFDANTYQPYDKSEGKNNSEINNEGEVKTSGSGEFEEKTTNDSEHKGHLYGNIGVTTSQQMLQSELEIAEWNIYAHITDLFIKEFLIPVYD